MYIYIHVYVYALFRFSLFDVEHRCHLTFDSDSLTLPVPHNTYHIYYTPNTSQSARELHTIQVLKYFTIQWSIHYAYIHKIYMTVHVHAYICMCSFTFVLPGMIIISSCLTFTHKMTVYPYMYVHMFIYEVTVYTCTGLVVRSWSGQFMNYI